MTDNLLDKQAGDAASILQREAASPRNSVFVSANAGTGKTQVLTMRVLRLLLSGAKPDTILCVTYTKAAAAEMRHRLYERLSNWAICDESALIIDMQEIGEGGAVPTQEKIDIARNLFAHILDNEDGPLIETVHSFCQSVLMRFPVEAGISPQFDLISDQDRDMLIQECFYALLEQSSYYSDTPVARAMLRLSQQTAEMQIFDHLKAFLRNRHHADKMAISPLSRAEFEHYLKDELDLCPPEELAQREINALTELSGHPLAQIATMLGAGGVRQQGRAEKIKSWLKLDDRHKQEQFALLFGAFFNKDGNRPAKYTDKAIEKLHPTCLELQEPVADCLEVLQYSQASAQCFALTMALTEIGAKLYQDFQGAKSRLGLLDYDDLIFFTDRLLAQEQIMAWVRWKLDRGVNHLLVDEAQDTSPAQWDVLRRLTDPFFDNPSEDQQRTIFAVGDFKQSIYSFQGARPDIFITNQKDFERRSKESSKPFKVIDFTLSFRSSLAVLNFVDKVMLAEEVAGIGENYQEHDAHRKGMPGIVEIWPIIETSDPTPPPYFDIPELAKEDDDGASGQAKRIVTHIKALLGGSEDDLLGRRVDPGDILILLRKRDSFYALLRAELERANIPVAGADRMVLNNQIEILDLLALADICLLPDDDLQLACLLKSPLCGLDEEGLMHLAIDREKRSLFKQLMSHEGASSAIGAIANQVSEWRKLSRNLSVFEFFSAVLSTGGRAAFHKRLGHAVDDSLNAFLLRAREHGQNGKSGLTHFTNSFRQGGGAVKRDMDTDNISEVRVMSMHGAKGLEAPIVYLPDMLRSTPPSDSLVTTNDAVYWPSSSGPELDFIHELKEAAKASRQEETDRLLYVALTRARQGLFISGWGRKKTRMEENSWYALLSKAIKECEGAKEIDGSIWRLTSGRRDASGPDEGERVKEDQKEDQKAGHKDGDKDGIKDGIKDSQDDSHETFQGTLPLETRLSDDMPADLSWYESLPPREHALARPLTPSDLGDKDITPSFGLAQRQKSLLRGNYVHKLFEVLPSMKEENRQAASLKIAKAYAMTGRSSKSSEKFTDEEINDLYNKTINIMADPKLAPLFGPNALAEAAISGVVSEKVVQGVIDRLCLSDKEVLLADFKTGVPPKTDDQIPQSYIRQMAVYGAIVAQMYPKKEVKCLLIWTQSTRVSEITQEQRQAALEQINAI